MCLVFYTKHFLGVKVTALKAMQDAEKTQQYFEQECTPHELDLKCMEPPIVDPPKVTNVHSGYS